jgi:hypothetical protein
VHSICLFDVLVHEAEHRRWINDWRAGVSSHDAAYHDRYYDTNQFELAAHLRQRDALRKMLGEYEKRDLTYDPFYLLLQENLRAVQGRIKIYQGLIKR